MAKQKRYGKDFKLLPGRTRRQTGLFHGRGGSTAEGVRRFFTQKNYLKRNRSHAFARRGSRPGTASAAVTPTCTATAATTGPTTTTPPASSPGMIEEALYSGDGKREEVLVR